jgi:hypothetical protein
MSKAKRIVDYYILVYSPQHLRAVGDGYVPEQILVAEKILGRPLTEDEDVRHVNGNAHDNAPSNLEIISLLSEYRTQILEYTSETKASKSSTKTFLPCKFQKPCWKEIRAPIARANKIYLPYICSFQTEGDIYKCSHFWKYLDKVEDGKKEDIKST